MNLRFFWASMLILCVSVAPTWVRGEEWSFRRGDLDGDGRFALGDPLVLLEFLFIAGSPELACLDSGDFDDDGVLTLIDGIDLLTYLFSGGPSPLPPFRDCGDDPTQDRLSCLGPLLACPPTFVEPPSDLVAARASHSQIDLSWVDNSQNETGFEIERSATGAEGAYVPLASVPSDTTSFLNTELTPVTEYCYRVRAVNDSGPSDYSIPDCATTEAPPPPAPPTNLVAISRSLDEIELGWEDNSTDETGFEIERSESGGPYILITTVDANIDVHVETDLFPATEYCYRVRAVHGDGESDYSNISCAITLSPPPPAAPGGLVTTVVSASQIDLEWTDNSDDESLFEVERSTEGGPFDRLAVVSVDTTLLSDVNLNPGLDYCYRVRAGYPFGFSEYSNVECATPPVPPPPGAPSGLVAAGIEEIAFAWDSPGAYAQADRSRVQLSWVDNSIDEHAFEIERSSTGSGAFQRIAVAGPNITHYFDSHLETETQYCYRVRAVSAFSPSPYSETTCTSTLTPPLPHMPSGLTARRITDTRADLAWADNANDETGFNIQRSINGGPWMHRTNVSANPTNGRTTYTDWNLTPGTDYCYLVRSFNDWGQSGFTGNNGGDVPACATTIPPSNMPAPTGLSPVGIAQAVELSWTDNSLTETRFRIERSVEGGGFEFLELVPEDTDHYHDFGLIPGTQYCYRVRAATENGSSSYSNTSCATAQTLPPTPREPSEVEITPVGPHRIEVAWTDNSEGETGFEVERAESGDPLAGFSSIATVEPGVTRYADFDLLPLTEYCYRVRSVNGGGYSIPSKSSCASTSQFDVSGLRDAYAFDEGEGTVTQDAELNDHPGMLENGATWSEDGQFGTAVELNGIAGNVNVGEIDLVGDEMAITAWFKADDFDQADAELVSKAAGPGIDDAFWVIGTVHNQGMRLRFRLKTAGNGATELVATGSTIEAGSYVHVAVTYDGTQMAIYQNGVPAGTAAQSGKVATDSTVPVWFGNNPSGSRVFDGVIDNVRIYERALSPWEIQLDMDHRVGDPFGPISPHTTGDLLAEAAGTGVGTSLIWADNSDDERSFEIERSVNGPNGPFVRVAVVGSPLTYYDDRELEPTTEYCYRVRAVHLGGASAYSNVDCATTGDPSPPPAAVSHRPDHLNVTVFSVNKTSVTWRDNSYDETGFEIQRKEDPGEFETLVTVARQTRHYFDFDVVAGIRYCYRVRAINPHGTSPWSVTRCKTTDGPDMKVKTIFDTGFFEVSERGPWLAPGQSGTEDFLTRVPIPDFDWTSPVDLAHGTIYHRLDISERPSLSPFRAKQVLDEPGPGGAHPWPELEWVEPIEPNSSYRTSHPVQSMQDDTGLLEMLDDPPELRMHFAVENQGTHAAWEDARFFPFRARFVWVLVSAGGVFPGWGTLAGPEAPTLEPHGLPFVVSQPGPLTVTMTTSTRGSVIRYTIDGSLPTPSSTRYTGPIQLQSSTMIRARTFNPGSIGHSPTTTVTYSVDE